MNVEACIIGAGPAGLMAAIHCAAAGSQTVVVETNTNAGRKLLLTGGGRCNLTHQATPDELVRACGKGGRFLSFAFHEFPPVRVRDFFRRRGLESVLDEAGCVFPVSQRASDVRDTLIRQAQELSVHFCYDRHVSGIVKKGDVFTIRAAGNTISAKKVVLATGGVSYPQTGSTGDGYEFAQHLGHTIIRPRAALVPLVTQESWPSELAGTTIDNVRIHSAAAGRKHEATGPLLFTDDGIAGPAVLDMSRFLTDCLPAQNKPIQLSVDMIAGMSANLFESRLLEQISVNPRKTIANVLSAFFPKRVAAVMCQQTDYDGALSANQVSRDIRKELIRFLKAVPLSVTGARPIEEATVTRGGVSTDEIDPKTMQSRICPGLFFAGEVIDVDGPCGGYNLQICWSTGALAGRTLTS